MVGLLFVDRAGHGKNSTKGKRMVTWAMITRDMHDKAYDVRRSLGSSRVIIMPFDPD
ncbi:hypothetical protein ANO14919_093190 [Xylariales sp. No.14919]|nr:hypothetical protein ANO14919_093190 [Xylariales sp. No.14919]